ncbi:uncharacterized protein [Aegilops tauschii subsp. strangulata]|uniref:uncharacterized protein n=1 Tax=Aegilops tauschii subsp. strangulata TaxID=200361 RepID=UPI003CC8A6D7
MTVEANGRTYNYGYYLADEIDLKWTTSVKPISSPHKKELYFHNAQTAARKDVERPFGILQSQFSIGRELARFWDQKNLWYIMTACVIMHNMIIENEHEQDLDYTFYDLMCICVRSIRREDRIRRFMEVYHDIRETDTHNDLQKDAMEEWWKWHGDMCGPAHLESPPSSYCSSELDGRRALVQAADGHAAAIRRSPVAY